MTSIEGTAAGRYVLATAWLLAALVGVSSSSTVATSVDTVVESVHFPEEAFPEDLGFRAVSVAASVVESEPMAT